MLEHWTGNDFGLGNDVRGIVLGGWKSVHVDDALHLELVRVMKRRAADVQEGTRRASQKL